MKTSRYAGALALAALGGLSLSKGAQAQNLVLNPGFETGNFIGWTLQFQSATSVNPPFDGYNPHGGNFFLALGNVGHDTLISQDLPTTAGTPYTVSWFLASNGTMPNDFSATFGGQVLFSQTDIPATGTGAPFPYVFYSFTAVATGPTTVLQFGGRDDPQYLALDDISVTPASPTSVPEPGSLALIGSLSLTGAGFLALRRRKRVC